MCGMGIIAKQSIKGSIYTYAGAIIGFLSAGILMPNFMQKEEIGLINLLISITIAFSQFSTLGFGGVITRLFPYFRDKKNKHNGILTIGLISSIIGYVFILMLFFLFKDIIIKTNIEKSVLFAENIYKLPVLIFFLTFFILLDNYNKVIYDAVTGTFLREFLVRIFNLLIIVIYIFDYISFELFINLYVIIFISPTLLFIIILIKRKAFFISRITKRLFVKYKKEMFKIAFFWIVAGFTWSAVQFIDKYMINQYLGLAATGVYSIAFYFGSLITMPARSVRKISSIVIAEAWKSNDTEIIKDIYNKSTINLLLISSLLFIGVWANIENVFKIIPEDFSNGKYVIFFIGLTSVFEMSSGVAATIISNSKDYKITAYVMIIMIISIIVTNIYFIQMWGIVGAAFASLVSTIFAILLRYLFLLRKHRFQPYTYKHLIIITISLFILTLNYLVPQNSHFFIDILIRSSLITFTFVLLIYISKVSNEFNKIINKILILIKK